MTDRPAIIVLANSARALAASARRAGFAPLAIDVFGDDDTRETCLAVITLDGGLSAGLTSGKVVGAVETLIRAYNPMGLVYGSGFERQPELIAAIARMTRIFGNDAETIKRSKDPFVLARLCAAVGISHPSIMLAAPGEPEDWLVKARGGSGGAHITTARRGRAAPPDCYFQRRVTGENVSALFVADGRKAEIIGLSAQWRSPTPASPFRYGGAAGPIDVGAGQSEGIARSVAGIASELGLVGLNSADFIVSDDTVWLIEINPRPGATLDVFEPDQGALIVSHIAACEGRLVTVPLSSEFKAAQVVYAPCDIVMPNSKRNWPDWTSDRPLPGTRVAVGGPLCTVLALGATVELARNQVETRARDIIADIQESRH
ncbi:MAG TPA: ATP-grasp domain-containing protein [Roseiarcus sp.]|jgi:predicted ATP-grasp superfamily ATP-dependent carboligase|nr:ATP-grasp domain-containing protein [Roseiarcus sp.]